VLRLLLALTVPHAVVVLWLDRAGARRIRGAGPGGVDTAAAGLRSATAG
jgi:hypothetical protein